MSHITASANTTEEKDILEHYRKYIEGDNYDFDNYNSVSIQHIMIAMSGMFGEEAKELATKLMKKFIVWYRATKPDNYFPVCGCQQMYPIAALEGIVTITEEYINVEPKKKLELFNNLIMETQKTVRKVSFQEYMQNKERKHGDKLINIIAVGGGAFLGWAMSRLFLK